MGSVLTGATCSAPGACWQQRPIIVGFPVAPPLQTPSPNPRGEPLCGLVPLPRGFPGWCGPSCSLSSPSIQSSRAWSSLSSQKLEWKARGKKCCPGRGHFTRVGKCGLSPRGCLAHTPVTSAPCSRGRQTPIPSPDTQQPIPYPGRLSARG